jgi:hypothetical protein
MTNYTDADREANVELLAATSFLMIISFVMFGAVSRFWYVFATIFVANWILFVWAHRRFRRWKINHCAEDR